jgi:hypothetical protein
MLPERRPGHRLVWGTEAVEDGLVETGELEESVEAVVGEEGVEAVVEAVGDGQ